MLRYHETQFLKRPVLAELIKEICKDVVIEPALLPLGLTGKSLNGRKRPRLTA